MPDTRPGARLVAVATAFLLLSLPAAAASAGSKGHSKTSGQFASTSWIEFGELGGSVLGNVHVGDLFVDGATRQPYVYGNVFDWTCPEGTRPPTGGHGFEEEPENPCTLESVRFLFAEPGQTTFTIDKKLTEARLTGTVAVSDHGGGAAVNPPVDITWTGVGRTVDEQFTSSFDDGTYRYTFRYRSSSRDATVTGRIGAMGFTDDPDDESSGQLGSYRSMERYQSR